MEIATALKLEIKQLLDRKPHAPNHGGGNWRQQPLFGPGRVGIGFGGRVADRRGARQNIRPENPGPRGGEANFAKRPDHRRGSHPAPRQSRRGEVSGIAKKLSLADAGSARVVAGAAQDFAGQNTFLPPPAPAGPFSKARPLAAGSQNVPNRR